MSIFAKAPYFIKLNLYAFLLTFIAIVLLVAELYFNFMHCNKWRIILFYCCWGYLVIKNLQVYGHYSHKLETLHRLVKSGRKKYSLRLFYPYMDTLCYRHMVYFSLMELGRTSDYKKIKHNILTGADGVSEDGQARVVRMEYKDGVMKFYAKDQNGVEEELE